MTRQALAMAALGVLGLLPARTSAHSLLLEASPQPGSTTTAPDHVVLRFNNRIEQALSSLRVVDEHGAAQRLRVMVSEASADRLVGALPRLAPGTYRLEWQVFSKDGHIVSGTFPFRVVP